MSNDLIRNGDGWFVNTAGFQEEARHFRKYGYYTEAPWGSDDWFNYWRTQHDRFVNGYTVGGVRITGAHYYYLNFCPINRTNIKKRQKGADFPDFWDYDYNYFHIVDIARFGCTEDELKSLNLEIKPLLIDGGHHLVVAKKRRAGYSYKNGALVSCIANTVRGALTIIGASDTKYLYPEGTMAMVTNYLDFMNEHTGLAKKREYVDKVSHRRLSFKEYQNGIPIEKGYKSDIMAITFRDNPDAARGKDAYLCLFEEAGKFPNLLQAYNATRPSLEDGVYVTGQLLCYGCVCAGTKVWTKDGRLINIETLKQEDGIFGFNYEKAIPEDITYLKPPTKKLCYRITTKTGRVLECSEDHPILTSSFRMCYDKRITVDGKRIPLKNTKYAKWIETKDLLPGQQVAIINSVPVFGDKEMWNPYMVGLLIGDGSYGFDKTPVLSNCDVEIVDYTLTNFNCVIEREFDTKDGRKYKEIRIKEITKHLRSLGIYGQTKLNKRLPDDIHTYNSSSLANLLAGFFDTDGYILKAIVLTSSCKPLLDQVSDVLVRFGIHSTVIEINQKKRTDRRIKDINNYYRLLIQDKFSILNFQKNIPIRVAKKKKALLELLNSMSLEPTKLYVKNDSGTYSSDLAGVKFEAIRDITCIGMQDVYNLTASSSHTYIANGIITHNTGGSFDSGGMEFAEMFYNPLTYNMLPFENVWDADARGTSCGFFVPAYKTLVGFIDDAGNSLTDKAHEHEVKIRESIKDGKGGMLAYNLHIQEYPHNPAEAFLQAGDNPFPIETLTPIRNKLLREDRYKVLGKPVKLFHLDNKVSYKIDMTGSVNPIYRYPAPSAQVKSGLIMYEAPPDNPPRGLFLIGYDPVNQDEGTSLASFFVYKTGIPYTETHNTIVAEYTGREDTTDDVNQILLMTAELYNADIMHENMSKDTITYFRTRRKMDRLLGQPDAVIQAATQKSVVRRKAGVHMTPALFSDGIKYINNWLLSVHHLDENEEEVLNAELIPSIGLLDEMISYRKKGNFDRLIAFIMIMFSVKESEIYAAPKKASYREELEVFLQTKITRGAKSRPQRFKYIES